VKKCFYIALFFLGSSGMKVSAQTAILDSLKSEYNKCANDSIRCFLLYFIVESEYNPEIWPNYNEKLGEIALRNYRTGPLHTKRYFLFYYAMSLSNKGFLIMTEGKFSKAIDFYNRALIIHLAIGDTLGIATAYTNIGYSQRQQGNIVKALDNYYKALKLQELLGDKRSCSVSYNNIGFVHGMQGEHDKALACYRKAEKIIFELGLKDDLAICYGNMAKIFYTHGDIENHTNDKLSGVKKGIEYLNKAIEIQRELKNYALLAGSLNTLGGVFENFGDPSCTESIKNCLEHGKRKAFSLYMEALKMREQNRDTVGLAQSYYSMASGLIQQGKWNEALGYAIKSLNIGEKFGVPERIMDASRLLKTIYEKQGKYEKAVEMFELNIKMRDSLSNEEIRKADLKKQFETEYEIQSSKDSIANVAKIREEQLLHETAIAQQRTYTYGGFTGLGLMLIVAGVSFKAYRNKQKANIIITEQKQFVDMQKHVIEEKQKEIIDSINYARRIQRAHLPNEKYISRKLKELRKEI
jgi:tetratricopeptide (TPR) repeat protein